MELRPTVEIYLSLVTKDMVALTIILSAICFCASFFYKRFLIARITLLVSSIFLFSSIDCIGFWKMLAHNGITSPQQYMDSLAYYRILETVLQNMIGLSLLYMGFSETKSLGWKKYIEGAQYAILFYFLHFFCVYDMLFYWLQNIDISGYGNMWWLDWTLPGKFGLLNPLAIKISAISGIIIAISYIIFSYKFFNSKI